MTLNYGSITILADGTATWTGADPAFIGTQPVWYPPVSPDAPVQTDVQPQVIKHTFGDGYARRAPKGLNHLQMTVTLTFSNIYANEKDTILQFLNARGAVEPFWWKQPNEGCRRWIAAAWGAEQQGWDRWRVSVRLERDWSPIV